MKYFFPENKPGNSLITLAFSIFLLKHNQEVCQMTSWMVGDPTSFS